MQFSKIQNSVNDLEKTKIEKIDFEKLKKEVKYMDKKSNKIWEELKKGINETDNYLEKYLPLIIISYNVEFLGFFLDRKELTKLFDNVIPIV